MQRPGGRNAVQLTCQEDTRKSFVPLCMLTALLRCSSDTMQFTHLKYPNNGLYLLSWATITRTNFITFFWEVGMHCTASRILVPWPEIEPEPQQWKDQVLTSGPAGNSPEKFFYPPNKPFSSHCPFHSNTASNPRKPWICQENKMIFMLHIRSLQILNLS